MIVPQRSDTRDGEILFTIYSKQEAVAALGEGPGDDASRFRALVERAHPDVRLDWKTISRAIAESLESLPETYDYRPTRPARARHQVGVCMR